MDRGGERGQDPGGEALGGGVERRGPHAVVGGDAADVDRGDAVQPLPGGEPVAVRVAADGALEAAVGRLVGALVEDRVEGDGGERGVQRLAGRADDAVPRPAVDVVRLVGEV